MNQILVGMVAALMVVGCSSEPKSDFPTAQRHDLTTQKKLKSAHHWDVIAADIANETKQSLEASGQLKQRSVYVVPPVERSAFSQGFHNFLITQLVRQGVAVSEKAGGALEVRYETQVVRHPSERRGNVFQWGAQWPKTALIAGVLVARNVHTWSSPQQAAAALALAGMSDYSSIDSGARITQTELLVTSSLLGDGSFVMRKSDVYYIEDKDGSLYQQVKEWKVVGS